MQFNTHPRFRKNEVIPLEVLELIESCNVVAELGQHHDNFVNHTEQDNAYRGAMK